MRLLVDTHVWLWWLTAPNQLSAASLAVLRDPANTPCVSAASTWEIVIKHAAGRLRLPSPPDEFIPSRMARDGFTGLAIEHAHVLQVANLPHHHRDPFDRILVAQAQVERMPVMTADAQFDEYQVSVIPAR